MRTEVLMAVDVIITELWKMMPFSRYVSILKELPAYIIRVQWGGGF
jgi:hypothetical protein